VYDRGKTAKTRNTPMKLGICSFAFHRTWAAGRLDFPGLIAACKALGCTQLDPWNAHLNQPAEGEDTVRAGSHPQDARLGTPSDGHVAILRRQLDDGGLPMGCIAVDGGHIHEADAAKRALNHERAHRWIDIAGALGASHVRIDAGGPEDLPAPILAEIAAGYRELIAHAARHRIRVLVENHWGPTVIPENVNRLLDAVDGLGLLFDTHNWKPGRQRDAWRLCAARAEVVHVKTFAIGDDLVDPELDLGEAFALLRQHAFAGIWCVESVPRDGDELAAARRTLDLIRREAGPRRQQARA
jgi:sugar phosphate isomerase/epimerase